MSKESLYVCLFNRLVLNNINLVVEIPERNELVIREPNVIEGYSDFDTVQFVFNFLKAVSDLFEKSARSGHSFIQDALIYLKIEAD